MDDIFLLGELFEQVQLQNVLGDGKTFVDCIPLKALEEIKKEYDIRKYHQYFDLPAFVMEFFILPKTSASSFVSNKDLPLTEHINLLWEELTRQPGEANSSSLIPLPHPYIIPGGRFREIYYWDSYFTMLGLRVSGKIDLIENMLDNFSYLIDKFGYIPNGNRTYFLGRSQPPFYGAMVQLLSEIKGKQILTKYLPFLEKEYSFWMKDAEGLTPANNASRRVVLMPDKSILNRYWDENNTPRPESYKEDTELASSSLNKNELFRNLRAACESGWDFSSRWLKDSQDLQTMHTIDIIPVDLNCLLYNLENILSEANSLKGNTIDAEKYKQAAESRAKAIETYCWNTEVQFYVDNDYIEGNQRQNLTLAGMYPLFFKLASSRQAESISKTLKDEFLTFAGLKTTNISTGQQWDSPNGWAPLQWIAVQGLLNYNYTNVVKQISTRWTSINETVYNNTGKMMEKYNVVSEGLLAGGGEYPSQDGFGWTNGVYLAFINIFKNIVY